MESITEEFIAMKKNDNGREKTFVREPNRTFMPLEKISWPSIAAGVIITAVTQMLLSLLGVGIGLSTVDPLTDLDPTKGLATGTIIWWSVTMLVSLFIGGWVTGRINKTMSKTYLTWNGLITYCTFTVFSFFMLTTTVGTLISGAGNIIGTAVTAGASISTKNPLDISSITRNVNSLLMGPNDANSQRVELRSDTDNGGSNTLNPEKVGGSNNMDSKQKPAMGSNRNLKMNAQAGVGARGVNPYLVDEVQTFFTDKNVQNPQAKQELIKTVSTQTGMSNAEASEKVNQWMRSYEELKAEAKVKVDQAVKVVSTASILGFFALIIGALVTMWAARLASPNEHEVDNRTERNFVKVSG